MIQKFILQSLDLVGEFGPFLLFIISMLLLRNKNKLFTYYVYGFFLNAMFNLLLKGIIKQPRPLHDPNVLKARVELNNSNRFVYVVPVETFGMPSGHAQSALYSTCFILLSLRDVKITLFFLLVCVLTMFQRVHQYFHTVIQVVVGTIIGIIFGFVVYYMANSHIVGKLFPRADDNAPIFNLKTI
jgi:membrane-associated phospholipid phosphatase